MNKCQIYWQGRMLRSIFWEKKMSVSKLNGAIMVTNTENGNGESNSNFIWGCLHKFRTNSLAFTASPEFLTKCFVIGMLEFFLTKSAGTLTNTVLFFHSRKKGIKKNCCHYCQPWQWRVIMKHKYSFTYWHYNSSRLIFQRHLSITVFLLHLTCRWFLVGNMTDLMEWRELSRNLQPPSSSS